MEYIIFIILIASVSNLILFVYLIRLLRKVLFAMNGALQLSTIVISSQQERINKANEFINEVTN